MEALDKFKKVSFPTIVTEHMHTVMTVKYGKYGMAYGLCLNSIFDYFNIVCKKRKVGSIKLIFNMITLEDNECVPKRGGGKFNPLCLN